MTRTTWMITDETTNTKIELVYYHFGKEPKFPAWYMKEGHNYIVKMILNFRLLDSLSTFFKCLTHYWIIKRAD